LGWTPKAWAMGFTSNRVQHGCFPTCDAAAETGSVNHMDLVGTAPPDRVNKNHAAQLGKIADDRLAVVDGLEQLRNQTNRCPGSPVQL
jgi:hypothetical protein